MVKKILVLFRDKFFHWRISDMLRQNYGQYTSIENGICSFLYNSKNALDIVERFKKGGYDYLVIMGSFQMSDVFCKNGIRVLWPEWVKEDDHSKIEFYDMHARQGYRLVRFRQIKSFTNDTLEFED